MKAFIASLQSWLPNWSSKESSLFKSLDFIETFIFLRSKEHLLAMWISYWFYWFAQQFLYLVFFFSILCSLKCKGLEALSQQVWLYRNDRFPQTFFPRIQKYKNFQQSMRNAIIFMNIRYNIKKNRASSPECSLTWINNKKNNYK